MRKNDEHCAKITSQKATLLSLAVEWHAAGHITETKRNDITMIVSKAQFADFKPLLFVIPYSPVAGRVQMCLARSGRAWNLNTSFQI